jgi:hypothetical protein
MRPLIRIDRNGKNFGLKFNFRQLLPRFRDQHQVIK